MQDTLEQRLDFIGLGEGVDARLEPVADSLARHLEAAFEQLARRIAVAPSAARFLYGRERIEADGGGLSAHWQKLLTGQFDKSFADTAVRTGQRHARIGVDPRWHVGSHALVVQTLIRGVVADGMAQTRKARRGPLALFDAVPPAQAAAEADALGDGVAAVVGAILLDLDLTFAGYVERLRLDAEAELAAERTRLRAAVAAAGRALDLAAQGQRDDEAMALDHPDLAPLRGGAEKLADRVIGLVEDLELTGKAMSTLAEQVLLGVRHLSAEGAGQAHASGELARALGDLAPAAAIVANGIEEHIRSRRTDIRRCRRAVRDLAEARSLLASVRQQAGSAGTALAQVDAHLGAVAAMLERLGADCSAEARSLAGLERATAALMAGISAAATVATGLGARMAASSAQGAELEQSTAEALHSIAALAGFADVLKGPEAGPESAEPVYPMPDHAALAAHWHVL